MNELDLANAGYLYVVEFSSGRLKVGFTTDPKTRLANHASDGRAFATPVQRSWLSSLHLDAKTNEADLVAFCRARETGASGREYFEGIEYGDVVEFAQTALTMHPVPAAAFESARSGSGRSWRRELARAFEIRSLRRDKAAVNQAADKVRIITSLANDANHGEAQEALFEAIRELYDQMPAPWAIEDPTATERYLVARGATTDHARDAAPEFELSMRTLFALSFLREPGSFEELARFCDATTS